MTGQRTGGHIYVVLALAVLAAIMSGNHPAPDDLARFLLLTNASEAAAVAGAIGEDPDAVMPND